MLNIEMTNMCGFMSHVRDDAFRKHSRSITMPGQGTVLADRHEDLLQGLSSWQSCRVHPAPASLELLLLSGAELCVLHLCSGPPGAWVC